MARDVFNMEGPNLAVWRDDGTFGRNENYDRTYRLLRNADGTASLTVTQEDTGEVWIRYTFKDVPVYKAKGLRWENLDLQLIWDADESLLNGALRARTCLAMDRAMITKDPDEGEYWLFNLESLYKSSEFISRSGSTRDFCGIPNPFTQYWFRVAYNGLPSDRLDGKEILDSYERLGVEFTDDEKAQFMRWMSTPVFQLLEEHYLEMRATHEKMMLILKGIMYGLPLETVSSDILGNTRFE